MKPDFLIIPRPVAFDSRLQPLDLIVFAVVYWFERMKDGKCIASNAAIAAAASDEAGGKTVGARSVQTALERLEAAGHVRREYLDPETRKKRARILTLVAFAPVDNPGTTDEGVRANARRGTRKRAYKVRANAHQISNITSNSDEYIAPQGEPAAEEPAPVVEEGPTTNDLIDLFRHVNPSWQNLFKRAHEREAIERLAKAKVTIQGQEVTLGRHRLARLIKILPQTNAMPYFTKAISTTPRALEENLGKLLALIEANNNLQAQKKSRAVPVVEFDRPLDASTHSVVH